MKPLRIGDVVGDYRVIDIAGSGGMGAVYKIEHVITRRIEAMKLLPPGTSNDPEHIQRFEREIQVQARLHHSNIVALYNAVRDGDSIALVMEFVEGESLQRMMERGPLPVETALDFAGQILHALSYAHEAGIIHRDVAPANIIITPERVAKLTDFGLARSATDLRLSTSGIPLGSPWYMSPEQVRGTGALDGRTDLYSMGAVLYEMLTGAKLFDVEGTFAVMRAHVEAEPPLPGARNPKVPASLDEIVRKAVAKDPAMRFQSADEFGLALLSVVAIAPAVIAVPSLPVTLPVPLPQQPSLVRRRHPLRVAMLTAAGFATLATGLYAIRSLPGTPRARVAEKKVQAVAPQQAAVPAVVTPVERQVPAVVPPPPPEIPLEIAKPAAVLRPRAPLSAPARRANKPEKSYAIRVSGADLQPAATAPPHPPAPIHLSEAPEPSLQPADSVEEAGTVTLPGASDVVPGLTTPQEAAPPRPPGTGNRFIRALGKVNPFRKGAKPEASKTPLKKD